MTMSYTLNKLDNLHNVDFSQTNVVRILLLFTSGTEARQKHDNNRPKPYNAKIEDLSTEK